MTLRDTIHDDGFTIFCNADEFAEQVVYYPHRFYGEAARDARTIKAVVEREELAAADNQAAGTLQIFTVHVHNDVVTGISSDELDTGGDQIEFAPRDGKASERKAILRLVTQDNGMLVLECR